MTVSNSNSKNNYIANGTNTTFVYAFKIFEASELIVYVNDAVVTNYTVTGVGDANGGTIVFSTAPANNAKVTILRNIPLTQLINLPSGDNDPSIQMTEGLDRCVMLAQKFFEELSRCIKVSPSSTAQINIPSAEPNKAIGWNGAGDALVNLAVVGGALLGNQDIVGYLKVSDSLEAKSLTLAKASPSDIYSAIYWRRYGTAEGGLDAFVDFVEPPASDVTDSNSQTATAGQTVFKVPVFVLQASDLQVKVNGTIVTNYTVSNVGYRNGEMYVTFVSAVATGATVLFERINLNNYRPLMSIGMLDPTDKTKKVNYIDLNVGNVEFNRGIRLPVNPNMTVTDQANHIYDCNGVVRHCGEVSAVGVLIDPRGVLSVSKTGTGQYVITCARTFPIATTFAVNPYVISNVNAYVSAGSVGTSAFTVQTRNASTNTLVDAPFCFAVFY